MATSPAIQVAESGSARRRESVVERCLLVTAVLASAFLVYLPTTRFGFVLDDFHQIVRNPYVQSWRFVPRYFAGHVWSFQYPHMLGNYYRPLFLLWLRISDALFGTVAWKWHLVSVALHVVVTGLVYLLARRIVRDTSCALLAALIFDLHAVHIEAVAYVSAIPELLNALLLLTSFLCYLHQRVDPGSSRARSWRWLAGSLALYALALLTKETALVLPMLIISYDLIFAAEKQKPGGTRPERVWVTIRHAAPYIALTVAYLVVRKIALKGLAHVVTPLPLSTVVATCPSLLFSYLKLLLWPVRLSAYYDVSTIAHPGVRNFVLPALAVLSVVTLLWGWTRRARKRTNGEAGDLEARAVLFSTVWLLLPILMVVNVRFLTEGELVHDRYLYLPSVGFSILAALALSHLSATWERFFGRPVWRTLAVLLLAGLLATGTVYQSLFWADELSLNYHSHSVAPNNAMVITNLAAAAAERGLYSPAIELYKQALDRNPKLWRTCVNLAYLYYQLGKLPEAEQYFMRSIQTDPVDGNQYLYLGMTRMRMGRLKEAEAAIRRALEVRPNGADYHLALGMVLKAQGNLSAAREEFKAELANNPASEPARKQMDENDAGHRSGPGDGSSQAAEPAPPDPSSQ